MHVFEMRCGYCEMPMSFSPMTGRCIHCAFACNHCFPDTVFGAFDANDVCKHCGIHRRYTTNLNHAAVSEYRHPCGKRFDLLVPEFIAAMSTVMAVGAAKYGECKWKEGLSGENGGINHALGHIMDYQAGTKSNHSDDVRFHLAQAAVNLMFEYYLSKEKAGYLK